MAGSLAALTLAGVAFVGGRNVTAVVANVVEIILLRETTGKVVLVSESAMIRAPYSWVVVRPGKVSQAPCLAASQYEADSENI